MRGDDQHRPEGHDGREGDGALRRAAERSVLQLSGEVGYRQATVAAIVERGGTNLFRFYETYAGKEQCYAAAYASAAEDLCERLLGSCAEAPDWTEGIRQALLELSAFTADDPRFAAGVIGEVHVAGGAALEKRDEVAAQLSQAVDRARYKVPLKRQPPALTPVFVVSAIEATVIKALAEERPLGELVPTLLFIAVACYFGSEAARRAVKNHPSHG
jgi:AcrR family transcriptional regulator